MFISFLIDLYNLRRQQWFRTEKLEEIQRKKLRRMIRHTYENVLYYRGLFDSAGVKPEDISTVEDLQKIPITTKEQLQKLEPEEIVAKGIDPNRCMKFRTSGSTGIPLSIFFTAKDTEFYNLIRVRAAIECGQRLRYRFVYIKAELPTRPKYWFENLGIWNKEVISHRDMFEKQIAELRRLRPHVIKGLTPKLFVLARFMKEKGIDDIRPRLIIVGGVTLDSKSREIIESAFGTELFDYYGCYELGLIAWECSEHNGYHINNDSLVMEVIKDGKAVPPGEMGKIVCTGLHSFAMPFIRYEIGDLGILSDEKCPCGRGLPLLKSIEGRIDDLFISPGGKLYTASALAEKMGGIPGISQFRIIQESLRRINVQIAPDKNFSEETIKEIKGQLLQLMGTDFDIKVEVIDKIPPDPSGKLRSIISKVNKKL